MTAASLLHLSRFTGTVFGSRFRNGSDGNGSASFRHTPRPPVLPLQMAGITRMPLPCREGNRTDAFPQSASGVSCCILPVCRAEREWLIAPMEPLLAFTYLFVEQQWAVSPTNCKPFDRTAGGGAVNDLDP